MRIKCGRAVNDCEKMVTPGILYASKSDGSLSVHLIAIGWWDFHVSFMWSRGKPKITHPASNARQDEGTVV